MRLYIVGAFLLLIAASLADARFGKFNANSLNAWRTKFTKSAPEASRMFEQLGAMLLRFSKVFGGMFNKQLKKEPVEEKPIFKKPDFCKKYECPPFSLSNKTDFYELRCYSAQNWVSTSGIGSPNPIGSATRKMFMTLLSYIQGANMEGTRMNMTVPALMRVEGDDDNKQLKMSFYIPKKNQKNVPKPTDPSVKIESNEFCAYVHGFPGFAFFYKDIKDRVEKLKERLNADGLKYNGDLVLMAGYNKPTDFSKRHNEIMLLKI